jgi:hypothetical protein
MVLEQHIKSWTVFEVPVVLAFQKFKLCSHLLRLLSFDSVLIYRLRDCLIRHFKCVIYLDAEVTDCAFSFL